MSTAVNLFPANTGGPAHLPALLSVFPGLFTVPTGGVERHDVPDFSHVGAAGVGIGSARMVRVCDSGRVLSTARKEQSA